MLQWRFGWSHSTIDTMIQHNNQNKSKVKSIYAELLAQTGLDDDQLKISAEVGGHVFVLCATIGLIPALYKNIITEPNSMAWILIALWLSVAIIFSGYVRIRPKLKLYMLSYSCIILGCAVVHLYDGFIQAGIGYVMPGIIVLNLVRGVRFALLIAAAATLVVMSISLMLGVQSTSYIATGSVAMLEFCTVAIVFVSLVQLSLVRATDAKNRVLERFSHATQAGHIAIFEYRTRTDTVEVNQIFRDIWELPEAQYPSISLEDLAQRAPPDIQVEISKAFREFLNNKTLTDPFAGGYTGTLWMEDGRQKWISMQMEPQKTFEHGVVIWGAAKDISDQIEREDALRSKVEQQRKMFGIISHELRSPASAIHMITNEPGVSDSVRTELATLSEHLLSVIDDLRMSVNPEVDAQIKSEPFDLNTLLVQVQRQTSTLIVSNGMSLLIQNDLQAPTIVVSDAYRLRAVLINLVRNSAMHSDGSFVRLTATSVNDDQYALVTLTVEDDGKGIPDSEIEQMYEPFVRGDTRARGTGVGLHLVETWVEKLGGRVSYRDRDGGGARFDIEIRLKHWQPEYSDAAQDSAQVIAEATRLLDKKSLLIVDDDNMLLEMTASMLQRAFPSVELLIAKDGQQALALLKSRPIDLVLTDYFMPFVNGREMIQQIRSDDQTTPIIGVTAATIGDEKLELMQAGASAVLAKPIRLDEFCATIVALNANAQSPTT